MNLQIIESDSNYCATIVRLPQLKKVNWLDNLMVATVFGYNCLVSKDSSPDDLYIFFPAETVLSNNFLYVNSLYRNQDKNLWKDKKGFFDDSGRVKAVKFKGVVSSGFLCPVSYIHQFVYWLKVGDTFHSINGVEICKKYRRPVAPERLSRAQSQSKSIEKFDIVIPNQFRFHVATQQFLRFIDDFIAGDKITITEKLHGTSAVFANVLTKRKLSLIERIAKYFWANIQEKVYFPLYSSRSVIKNSDVNQSQDGGYYWEDVWGIHAKQLEPKIEKGITLYGEIVGYTPSGQWIQKGYHYGCKQGESKFYVYRMTYTTPDGNVIEFTDSQIRQYCGAREIEVVPLLNELIVRDFYLNEPHLFVEDITHPMSAWDIEVMCPLNNNKVPREWVVIRRDGQETYSAYKLKSQLFLTHETKEIDNWTVDTEENS